MSVTRPYFIGLAKNLIWVFPECYGKLPNFFQTNSCRRCSVAQLCPILCDPMDCSTPGFPVLHYLPELAQTQVRSVSDASQPSCPVTPSPLTLIFPSIRLCSNELALGIRWPKYWSFSISPSNEYSGLISFRINWFDLLPVQGTLKSLFQHYRLKASILWHSASLWSHIHT